MTIIVFIILQVKFAIISHGRDILQLASKLTGMDPLGILNHPMIRGLADNRSLKVPQCLNEQGGVFASSNLVCYPSAALSLS
jgi:hypothetical protein